MSSDRQTANRLFNEMQETHRLLLGMNEPSITAQLEQVRADIRDASAYWTLPGASGATILAAVRPIHARAMKTMRALQASAKKKPRPAPRNGGGAITASPNDPPQWLVWTALGIGLLGLFLAIRGDRR